LGWLRASGLGPKLVAKPAIPVFRQARQNPRRAGSKNRSAVLVWKSVFALWGSPPKIGSGPATLKFRFVHRIIGGGFYQGASAGVGARAAEQVVVLVARAQVSQLPPANQSFKFVPAFGLHRTPFSPLRSKKAAA
jgi:hypothetical protein